MVVGLLAAIVLSGLSYIPHNTLFSLSSARASGSNPIQIENSKPGTPGWNDFSADLAPDTLSGFGSKISVNHGDSLDLYVTTAAPSFTIDIFRTGYYGGDGARLITSLGSFPGLHQAIPAPDPVTGMISCTNWTKTTTLTIPSSWVTGVYLAKLTSSTGKSSFIYFVVRNDGGNEDVMFQTSVTTYQAYNTWGGTSLYNNDLTNKTAYPYAHATKVSFDRPFNPGDSNGAGHYFFYEYKFVYWMEQQGYNVAYTTDVDTDAHPAELLKHKAFLSVGHDEYWTMGMRNALQSAINAGVNVAFFAGNVMYWQIRFEPNTAGVPDRVEVGYKDYATYSSPPGPDPLWNTNNSLVTTLWRDPVINMPENGIDGVMYEQQEDNDYAYVVANASNWIYAGTGFVDGTSVPGIVGYEYDKVWNNGFSPANETVLSNSPVNGCCGGGRSFSNSTLYTAPSGARVFAAGTIQWSLGLANIQGNTYMNAGIQKTTANILNNFINSTSAPSTGITMSADNLSFGNQGMNKTGPVQTVKITNSSSAVLTISNIAVTGTNAGDFTQTNTCPSSLATNASCTISVTFKPSASGGRSANITLTDSSTMSPQVIVLSGIGIASGAAVNLSASNLSFGNQTVNTTSPTQKVTVTNTGTATLTFSYIQMEGLNANDFSEINNCPTNLAVGASCTVTVTFTPTATSTRAGSLTFIDNASDSAEQAVLSGTGVAANPGVTLNPSNLSFGNQNIGTTSAAQTTTLTNKSASALAISGIAITGTNASDFAQTNTCPSSLASNASCTISVTFTPQSSSVDARTASIAITDNGPASPQTVTLSGTGVTPNSGVQLSSTLLNFGNQNNGTTSNAQSVTLTNNGNAALAISSIAVTGTNAGDFTQANTCPVSPSTLAVQASCTISVSFTPTVSGARNATITITDNTDGEGEATQTITLSGTGVSTTTTTYFTDGFESGDFSQWTGGTSGAGAATVQSSVVNNGTHAAQLTNAAGQSIQVSTALSGIPALNYTRFYFR
ncbi:MAG: choice-of-anchor D domain-containing protein, partial [Ktedonobacteraceae bacterium]|nr:choice-of-anchor D domain-containing protein [Ktedonobacteraceae bacterium]